MTNITFHIKLASDVQAVMYAQKSSRTGFWRAQIDERHLTPVEREHLLRMARSDYPKSLEWNFDYDPVGNVYATAYKPDASHARLIRELYAVDMNNDSGIVRLVLDDAEPLLVVRAAIAADRARFLQAHAELVRLLHEDVIAFLHDIRARIASLIENGANAITENEIEYGYRPQKPKWYDAVVNRRALSDAIACNVEREWRELNERFEAALAEARARREEAKREAETRARIDEERKIVEAREWIEQFGSKRLRTLVERGLPFWREYVDERIRVEYPEFEPAGRKTWRDFETDDNPPTDAQIELADRHNAKIVCVTQHLYGYSRDVPRVVIPNAFGGIDLIERDQTDGDEE